MKEIFKLIVVQHNGPLILISTALLALLVLAFLFVWVQNRKKFHRLTHQIPASVVKNYLDSIIHNSTALKSSLFRGGGVEVGQMPSIMPLDQLMGNTSVRVEGNQSAELSQKNALIHSLENQLADRSKMVADLEMRIRDLEMAVKSKGSGSGGIEEAVHQKALAEISELKIKNEKLSSDLSVAAAKSGNESELSTKFEAAIKERDDLKSRLQEYEIIEDDLANLKRLQQENEELKKQLAGKGSAPVMAEAPIAAVEEVVADTPAPQMATTSPDEVPEVNSESKSQEDLLSEFEKMLG